MPKLRILADSAEEVVAQEVVTTLTEAQGDGHSSQAAEARVVPTTALEAQDLHTLDSPVPIARRTRRRRWW